MPKLVLNGVVVSDKMDKTVVVQVKRIQRHSLYHKDIIKLKKYHAHDETNAYKKGDYVYICENAPLSKTKSWIVTGLVSGAKI